MQLLIEKKTVKMHQVMWNLMFPQLQHLRHVSNVIHIQSKMMIIILKLLRASIDVDIRRTNKMKLIIIKQCRRVDRTLSFLIIPLMHRTMIHHIII